MMEIILHGTWIDLLQERMGKLPRPAPLSSLQWQSEHTVCCNNRETCYYPLICHCHIVHWLEAEKYRSLNVVY